MVTATEYREKRKANQESKSPANSATEECPAADCAIDTANIQCGHSERGYVLDLLSDEAKAQSTPTLQIISSDKEPDKVSLIYQGNCKGNDTAGDSPFKQDYIYDMPPHVEESFLYFFKNVLIPTSAQPQSHLINTKICPHSAPLRTKIDVFPKIDWQGDITLGYSRDDSKSKDHNADKGFKQLEDHGKWVLEGTIAAHFGDKKLNLGSQLKENKAKKGTVKQQVFGNMQTFLNKMTPFLSDLQSNYGSIKIGWPKIKLGGGLENIERKDSPALGLKGNAYIDFDPLIGATFTTDILDWVILIIGSATGGYGAFLVKIKNAVAEGVKNKQFKARAEIKIDLSVEGDVGGKLEWTAQTDGTWKTKGRVTGRLGFKIEGKASAEVSAFIVKAVAILTIVAQSEDGKKNSELTGEWTASTSSSGPTIAGQLEYNGLAIYYTEYYEVSFKNIKSELFEKEDKDNTNNLFTNKLSEEIDKLEKKKVKHKKSKKLVVLIKPTKWPGDKNDQIALDKGEL